MTYYSQYKQDVILDKHVFKGFKNGFFVDVGAHDGKSLNNTLYFEESLGWSGINIEPINSVYDNLIKNRPNDINLNIAIDKKEGVSKFLKNTGYTEMLSGLQEYYESQHHNRLEHENKVMSSNTDIIEVPTRRLDNVLKEHNINHVHLLSIDVEGAELAVFESINFEEVFIDVIVFEDNYQNNYRTIMDLLKDKGFLPLAKVQDIFLINKNSEFLSLLQTGNVYI
jgi:FkbM family methyltransferase